MGLENIRAANADTGGDKIGATWIFQARPGGVVAPGGKSDARVLRFEFDGGMPKEPAGYFEPLFVIYATATGSALQSSGAPKR